MAAGPEPSFATWLQAALLLMPADAVVSHTSAARLYGYTVRRQGVLEFSTNTAAHTAVPEIVLHRRRWQLHPRQVGGFWATGPDRTFVDIATRTALPDLVAFGDHLVHAGHTTLEDLRWYADSRHLDGVRRARRIAPLVRVGVESPPETVVRLMARFSRLPEPEVNGVILDDAGAFLARGDLVYRQWRVVVEYDGLHHLTDRRAWQHDLRRRELLEAQGWTVIVITVSDLQTPEHIPIRIHGALTAHGYRGASPVLSSQWRRWFSPRRTRI
ncbi:MAG: DUF559 domain-containing protein [Aeromicrobium sp.]|uniref:DUF559 domain-containing protein n=1 Tax=Aeromicrobium sp. TaxID=1871063 RepID=UPI00260BACFA|nr:DUF559 domain-containing protein [Aeromicrobium sp.]MDF1705152.1 DUF559 domain-containing protein [Aeromicrobium sp.]